MAITSASTPGEIRAQYLDSLGYEAANSLPLAQAFLAACLALSLVLPSDTRQDRGGTTFNVAAIDKQIERVRLWIALHPSSAGGGTGRYLATDEFRGYGGSVAPDPGGMP